MQNVMKTDQPNQIPRLTNHESDVVNAFLQKPDDQWTKRTGGKWRRCDWLRVRGIGLRTVAKLEKLGLVQTENDEEGPFILSVRASNILHNAGIQERVEAVKKALEAGVISPGKTRSYGLKTEAELCRWAGLPCVPGKSRWKFDPYTGKPRL